MLRGHGVVRFVAGPCGWCGETFTLDRFVQPWARSRTCSAGCAKRVANCRRSPSTCRHCAMVEAYRLARDADVRAREVPAADEERHVWTFREWLAKYEWECEPEAPAVPGGADAGIGVDDDGDELAA